jgi:hypothetical protein
MQLSVLLYALCLLLCACRVVSRFVPKPLIPEADYMCQLLRAPYWDYAGGVMGHWSRLQRSSSITLQLIFAQLCWCRHTLLDCGCFHILARLYVPVACCPFAQSLTFPGS